ncbi:MAG: bifunctional 4-hydroxy-2-oxoglutarate aldolase/2-dehydro-3-deoxy-phosphogluconate aldolase [Cyclobacteriaceae bacterium]
MNERLTHQELLRKAKETSIIPVFSHDTTEVAFKVIKACYYGGIRVFEFTYRSQNALKVFQELQPSLKELPGLSLGIGTIMDIHQCRQFYNAGASFIVSPIVDKEVAMFCQERQISWTPGCGTLTEIITAERLGAQLIKVFPADVLGPKFIRSVLGPCSHLNLMPTGGVTPSEENLKAWFDAGVACVGMGSKLLSHSEIRESNYEGLTRKVARLLSVINQIKL